MSSIYITPMTESSSLYARAAELEISKIFVARVPHADIDLSHPDSPLLTLSASAKTIDQPLAKHEIETLSAVLSASTHAHDLHNLRLRRDHLLGECAALRHEEAFAAQELTRIRSAPLAVGQFGEMVDEKHAVVHANSGQSYFVRVMSTLPREDLRPNAPVALHRHSSAVVKTLPPHVDAAVSAVAMTRRPEVSFRDIGGLEEQKRELREAVELPLTHGELFRAVGVEPPRGVLLHGPPGTGKTMMAKAVAESSRAAFINVVGSEFVQKYIGEGARMVRNVFQMAKESAEQNGRGAIIFIDEIDAIGMARHDSTVSSDREVQRIMLELLNQMDGFDQNTNVKVIMATNRPDTLDPALMRPGRLDRKIEFPLPDRRQRRLVFATATAKMQLAPDVELEDFIRRPERLNSAEIASICAEAGLRAIRGNRYMVSTKDFEEAYEAVVKRTDKGHDFYS